jgi:hypothetical protein
MVSNVAVGACLNQNDNHFDGYFELVDHQRRPTLKAVPGAAQDPPDFPEICRAAFISVSP